MLDYKQQDCITTCSTPGMLTFLSIKYFYELNVFMN